MKNEVIQVLSVLTFCSLASAGCGRVAEGELFRPLRGAQACGAEASPSSNQAGAGSEEAIPEGEMEDPTSMPALQWDVSSGCIPVTFDVELTAQADAITQAVAAWNDVECSALCLEVPVVGADAAERTASCGIHVRSPKHPVLDLDALEQISVVAVIDYERATGDIVGARLQVTRAGETALVRSLTRALGFALGFTTTASGTPSIRSHVESDWPEDGLSSSDRAAVLSKYGTRASCPN